MSNTEQQEVVPLEQALVPFYHKKILAGSLPDGNIAATLNSLCAIVGLAPHGQLQRIRRDVALSRQLLLVTFETSGGPQRMDALTAGAIPLWLSGVRLKMIAPHKRPLILALKMEVVDLLCRYFLKVTTGQVSQPIVPQTRRPALARRKLQQLTRPSRDARSTELESIKAAIRRLDEELDTIKAAIQRLERGLEEVQAKLRNSQQEQQARNARDEARLARLEGAQVREKARLDHLLDHLGRLVAHLTAEPLASRAELVVTERLMKAVIERLLLLEERVSQLEPKPPPRSKGGRPRRDRRR